jgi:hypothetical protein
LAALLTTLQGAFVGSVLGGGPVYLGVVIFIPVMVAGFEIDTFGPAVRNAIVGSPLVLAVGATTICALPLGLWAHYMGSDLDRD